MPFKWETLEERLNIKFDEFQDDGLGLCKYCLIDVENKKCVLECHPQGPDLAKCAAVLVLSYEEEWEKILTALTKALQIKRSELLWIQTGFSPAQWLLYRIDDNGNEVSVHCFPDEERAKRAQRTYEERGHKQTYLIKKIVDTSNTEYKEYKIVEMFNLTGRGAAVVIEEVTEHSVGRPYKVQVLTPDGEIIDAVAYKEWILWRHPKPIEKEAYLLKDLYKDRIPEGSLLRFFD